MRIVWYMSVCVLLLMFLQGCSAIWWRWPYCVRNSSPSVAITSNLSQRQ